MRQILSAAAIAAIVLPDPLALAASATATSKHQHSAAVTAAAGGADAGKVNALGATLRDLWIGHVFWVRNVVTARLAGDSGAEAAAEGQVVANAKTIAGAIEPFYGAAAKDKLFGLLTGHYGAVKGYLDASVANNASGQSEAASRLTANAGEIARFLASANPNLPAETVEGLLQAHGGHHIAQIQQLQAKDFAAEAKTWADMTQHMYVIADALGGAIAKQFPAKFAAR